MNCACKVDYCAFQKQRYECIENLIEKEHESWLLTDDNVDDDFPASLAEDEEDLSDINPEDYPFENLIFEGGGTKGFAYYGALKALEETKILRKIKRFAGTSAGAVTATLLAVGYSFDELMELMDMDMETLMKDGNFFYRLYNLFYYFGLHPGDRFEKWLGDKLKAKTGSADITFEELWSLFGIELCVVVTNVNWMRAEYCHLKTTPDMPIGLAVRMSSSIPGFFTAKRYQQYCGSDIFVDGGIISAYPIHCYDGWFLSLAKEDNFIERLLVHDKEQSSYLSRFKPEGMEVNIKSLGFHLFGENDLQHGISEPETPEKKTKLYRKRLEEGKYIKKAKAVHQRLRKAIRSFLKALDKRNLTDGLITKEELKGVLDEALDKRNLTGGLITKEELKGVLDEAFELDNDQDEEAFSKSDAVILFLEKTSDLDSLFDWLDKDKDGKIDQTELINFIGGLGIPLHERSVGYLRREVEDLVGFFGCLVDTAMRHSEMVHVKNFTTHLKDTDLVRTVGINTGYIRYDDFDLEEGDREFLLKRGYNACKKFLLHYVQEQVKPEAEATKLQDPHHS